jgi:BioD-like phosphotransacetylase family protein
MLLCGTEEVTMTTLDRIKSIVVGIQNAQPGSDFDRRIQEGIREETDPLKKDHKVTVIEGATLEFVKAEVARSLNVESIKIGNAHSVSLEELASRIDAYN